MQKKKMRQAAVNPLCGYHHHGSHPRYYSVVQFILDFWGNISVGIFRQRRRMQYIRRFLYCIFCCLLIDQYNSAVWLQLLLFEGGEPGWVHVLWRFVFVAEISAEGHRTDAYDLNFVMLWCLLLIIPGIIAAYRYSQAIFIMVEDPDKGMMQCIRESKEMMAGHKMEYFILEISFFFWMLLGSVTCGLAYIYVYPYMTVTFANYYNRLKPVSVVYEDAEPHIN